MMPNLRQLVQGWQPINGKRIQIRRGYRWLLPAVILTLELGIGSLFQSSPSQAQDGAGSGPLLVLVSYTIEPPTSEITVCLERDTTALVTVERTLEFRGDTAGAPGASMDASVQATTQDSGIATVTSVTPAQVSAGTNTWKRSYEVKLKGVSPGRTTVTATATVDDPINYGYASVRLQATFRIRVMPCEYRVNINSIWVTNFFGAETILIGVSHNIRLKRTGGDTFEFEPDPTLPPFLQWTWSVNRIRGCYSSAGRFEQLAPRITGTIQGDHLAVSLDYYGVAPPIYGYWDKLCPPPHAGEPCSERPDGICAVFPPALRSEWTPGGLGTAPSPLLFLLNGETKVISHPLTGRGGPTTGPTIITIVPVHNP